MKINEIIKEMIGDSANIRTYSAYETPSRKDFIPLNKSDYSNDYQQNIPDGGNKISEVPIKGQLPWPLESVIDDFTQSYVNLYSVGQKVNESIVNNKSLTKKQKTILKKYLEDIKTMMDHIKFLGSKIVDISKIN